MSIDHATSQASKTHAGLAAGYLGQEVEAVMPHDLPDVLMEGVRLLGEIGEVYRVGMTTWKCVSVHQTVVLARKEIPAASYGRGAGEEISTPRRA